MVLRAFNPRHWRGKGRPGLKRVPGQPELHSETLPRGGKEMGWGGRIVSVLK